MVCPITQGDHNNKAYSEQGITKEISYIWMNVLLYHFISQWFTHMSNLQIQFGARLR